MSYSFFGTCFEDSNLLKDCLLSIHNQTIKPNEIILIDSSKSDRILKYLKEIFKLEKTKIIYKNINLPRVKALNCGSPFDLNTQVGAQASNEQLRQESKEKSLLIDLQKKKEQLSLFVSRFGAKASKARTAKSPDVAKKRATTTTRLNQLGETNRRQRAAEASAPKLQKKAASKLAKQDTNRIASTPASKLTETRMARLAKTNRANRRMGGGSMKKVQGYKSGGVVRGAGAATRGKGFNRAG